SRHGFECPTPGCLCPPHNTRPSPPSCTGAASIQPTTYPTSTARRWQSPTGSNWPPTTPDSNGSTGSGGSTRCVEAVSTSSGSGARREGQGRDGYADAFAHPPETLRPALGPSCETVEVETRAHPAG